MQILLPLTILVALLGLAAPAQADLSHTVQVPPTGDQIEIEITNGGGDGAICLYGDADCFICVGLAGPTLGWVHVYKGYTTQEGLGVGVGNSDAGLTVKVSEGQVDCPREFL